MPLPNTINHPALLSCSLSCLTSPSLSSPSLESSTPSSPSTPPATDDLSIKPEPCRHVDYFSHPWTDRDISTAWRLVKNEKHSYHNARRLENAVWRSWAKHINNLHTVDPHSLNWLKDRDVTWLYGPLFSSSTLSLYQEIPNISLQPFHPKPILKKTFASLGLRQYASATNLVAQASQSDQRLGFHRTPSTESLLTSTVTSGCQTPNARKHIHFNDRVEQCIALDCKEDERENNTKIIAKLPSTRLKDSIQPVQSHTADPEQSDQDNPLDFIDIEHPLWVDKDDDQRVGWIETALDVVSTVREIVTVLWNLRRA